tara:strand:- start:39323 stop:39451 length:129 start_codon:yes stop_codon:yes gene_type:complete
MRGQIIDLIEEYFAQVYDKPNADDPLSNDNLPPDDPEVDLHF